MEFITQKEAEIIILQIKGESFSDEDLSIISKWANETRFNQFMLELILERRVKISVNDKKDIAFELKEKSLKG